MKLSTKLISSFTCVILLLVLIGLASQYFYDRIKDRVIDESQGAVKELEVSGELEAYLYQSFINAQYYLDEPYRSTLDDNLQDSLLSVQNVKREVRISLQGMNFSMKRMERLLSDENRAVNSAITETPEITIDQLSKGIMFYESLIKQLLNYETDNFEEAKALLNVTIEPYYRNKLLPMVDRFRSQIRGNLDSQVVMLNNQLNQYSNLLLLATGVAFLFSLILAYFLYKSITRPIHELSKAAEEIGHGNLAKRIEIKSDDEIGKLGISFNRMAENLNKITFSKEYVDDIIESMGDALIVTDKQAHITKINSATLDMLGYRQNELIGKDLSVIFEKGVNKKLLEVGENAEIDNFETNFIQHDGQGIPVSLSKAVIHSSDRKIEGLVYLASDITERKQSEEMIRQSLEEKEIMLAEIHHRVKNNLAVISGLLQMQEWKSENKVAKNVLQDSQLRVKSIALVHDKLYRSESLSNIAFHDYVEDLIQAINQTFKKEDKKIVFDVQVEPLALSVNKAITCSLLLNELIVNIHKHAFKNIDEGKACVRIWEDGQQVHIIVKDNGIGMEQISNNGARDSLGMTLINTLVSQLKGDIEVSNSNGATFKISFDNSTDA